MLHFFYSFLTWLLLPFGLFRLWLRGIETPAYRQRWRERLAWYEHPPRAGGERYAVFHAVSVGEVHAAQPLIEAFMQRHPGLPIVLTTATPTGSQRVRALFGERVEHVYLPWDLPGATRRFLRRYNAQLLILLETELWPNLLRECSHERCKVVLANARLSEKSRRGYSRFRPLTRRMLGRVALVAAQSEADAERFLELGLAEGRLSVNGSLKFDVAIDTAQVQRAQNLKGRWPRRPVWIAASTREGEDALVLQAHAALRQHCPEALLLLVPRHPERFREAGRQAEDAGFKVRFFSRGETPAPDTGVLVGDTMGDMILYYSLADLAFVGGSLVPTGCQNIIEPAALGLPVLTGPSLYNFQKVSELLRAAGGMQVVNDPQALAARLRELLADDALRRTMGAAAKAEVARNQGAAQRLNELLDRLLLY